MRLIIIQRVTIVALVLFISIRLNAQTDYKYDSLITEAGLFHLQKNYNEAIDKFEEASKVKNLDALNSYKLAGAYSLAKQSEEAFHFLEQSLDNGWTEASLLTSDPYFEYLKNEFPEKWEQINIKALDIENKYEKTLKYPQLRRQINLMAQKDQELRYQRIQATDPNEIEGINTEIHSSDFRNLDESRAIIKKYGWPKISDIGKDGQNNLWLIVQHADQDILFQKWALSEMEKFRNTKEIDLENYAFLYDRVQCNLNYRQLYGTQVNWTQNGMASDFRPILKENAVNARRKSLGLQPLNIYALNYGFTYQEISSKAAAENEQKDQLETKKRMDTAKSFYKIGEFQKVYDYYNSASTIMGGMSEKHNYEAALLFAKIYNGTQEEQYREIALDFLTLAYYRGKLNVKKLKSKREFESFYNHHRWNSIVK